MTFLASSLDNIGILDAGIVLCWATVLSFSVWS